MMVAYNKRYDPAYVRLVDESRSLNDLRLLRITTLESPLEPYVKHYNLHRGGAVAPDVAEGFAEDNSARITAAIGDADPLSRWAYHLVLLDSLVHEFNAMRGLMGEPDRLEFADIRETGVTAIFTFGPTQCVLTWVDLPGIARYAMEFDLYSPDRRLALSFPSPFLRSAPTILVSEGGSPGAANSWRTEEITSFEESFKQELVHFHECATTGRTPTTSAADTIHDIALCEAVVQVHRSRTPRDRPSEPALTVAR
jgi:predicted dehydrogenase